MSLDVWLTEMRPVSVFEGNITHNLGRMAEAAGIYKHLWRPEEVSAHRAIDLIGPLSDAVVRLHANPEEFEKFDPENGWGDYKCLLEFCKRYLNACIEHPEATIEVSR